MKKRLVIFFMRAFSLLPFKVHNAIAHFIGWLCRVLIGYRKKVVVQNITNAFPDIDPKCRQKIVKDFYLHLGQLICQTIWFGGSSKKRLQKTKPLHFVNPEEFKRLKEQAPGTVVLCSHLGNWEMYSSMVYLDPLDTLTPENCAVVYRRLKSELWNEIFELNRLFCLQKEGVEYEHYVESSLIMRHILSNKNKKMFYLFITDQWPYFKAPSYIEVDFMGQKTRTMSGAAQLAVKLKLAVSYMSMNRNGHGYDIELKTIADNAADLTTQQIMDKYYKLLEQDIKKDPGNYLWSHKRWKKY